MLRSLVNRALAPAGYRITRSPHAAFRRNPRFDDADFATVLSIVRSHTEPADWLTARKYLAPRRVSFYYDMADILDSNIVDLGGRSVLDVGVFYGFALRMLQRRHPQAHLFGTDTNPHRLKIAGQLCPNAKLWLGTIDTLEADQRYDLILLTEVLEHLQKPWVALHKLAALGQRLFLTVPNGRYDATEPKTYRPEWTGYLGHVNFWFPESWPQWLEHELPNWQIVTGELPTGQLYALATHN